ncbi:MAG TPA: phosphatidate cytidylyltransferase [Bryobacteraceae bacterium]|nr:phosphatidate cytidylyltransferase [Bryobacteraceae bacterium]
MRRILTSLILVPFIVWVVLWSPVWIFLVVLAAVGLLCYFEYSGIVAGHGIDRPGPMGYGAGLVILAAPNGQTTAITLLGMVALSLMLSARELSRGLPRAAALLLGAIYIFGSWRCAIDLRAISPYWLCFALALNWVGDVAAYYAGRSLGRHKLASRVSPAKSWEGAIASLCATLLFAAIYFPRLLPSVPIGEALALAAAGNVAGQIGDLCESALKRGAGLKDSGTLLPGHGGWLDRVDSSLFAVPVVYALVRLIL